VANFEPSFEKMIKNEGGYVLHTVAGDNGGQTYAGIARNFHSSWKGWDFIDRGDTDNDVLTQMVREFYKKNFWDRIKGDDLNKQGIAESLFDFSVNAGIKTASKLAQLVIGTTPDGIIGARSLEKINASDEEVFILKYALAKITRYTEIVKRNPKQRKFYLGWINRTLGALS